MDWMLAVDNPQALAAFPAGVGVLPVDLHEVMLHRDGPSVRLRFDLAVVPDPLPARWDKEANRTQVRLACFGVRDFTLTGFDTLIAGQLAARRVDDAWEVTFIATGVVLRMQALLLRVESLSGYLHSGEDD